MSDRPVTAVFAEISDQRLISLDAKVDKAEGEGIEARWEFGRELLSKRKGKQLPPGYLNALVEKTGKSRQEFGYRMRFAERFPTHVEVANVVGNFGSWHAIVNDALAPERPTPKEPPPLPEGRFGVLYIDPPWEYDFTRSESRAIENQYATMSLDAIKALEVPAADNSVLFLWATSPKLDQALEVLEAWGFTYKTCMVWVKDKIGMGYYARQQHELLLIAGKGEPPIPETDVRPSSVVNAPRGKHSEKPERFYELIETMYPDHAKLELFARSERSGWASWGNEVEVAA